MPVATIHPEAIAQFRIMHVRNWTYCQLKSGFYKKNRTEENWKVILTAKSCTRVSFDAGGHSSFDPTSFNCGCSSAISIHKIHSELQMLTVNLLKFKQFDALQGSETQNCVLDLFLVRGLSRDFTVVTSVSISWFWKIWTVCMLNPRGSLHSTCVSYYFYILVFSFCWTSYILWKILIVQKK